jgi:two-component system sensor histidine kinase YesM
MVRKLTTLIVISFVAINGLFLIGVSLMSYKVFFDFTSEEISETRLTLLNESMEKVSNFSESISGAGIYMAANENVIQTFSEPLNSAYDSVVEQRELTELLNGTAALTRSVHSFELYTDRYKNYLPSRKGVVFPMNMIKQEPWFLLFETLDNGWIPKHTSLLNNQEVISYVHRLMNRFGTTVGYIKVNVLADTFFDNMVDKDFITYLEEPLLLLDQGGRIIAQTHAQGSLGVLDKIVVSPPSDYYKRLFEKYDQLSNHHQILQSKDDLYLLLISEPNDKQWRMVHLIPVDSLYAETRKLGWLVVLLGFGALILSIPLVYWVGTKIIIPIRRIISGMRYVEKGRFDVRIERQYIEEYDILAEHFNHMASELNHSVKELKTVSRARKDAELRMLQSQIMPHFLYNTLDIIHWKAMDYQAEDISLMVNQLSKMFRIGLSGGRNFIRLQDELEHASCYIKIQRYRLIHKIDYEVNVSGSMKEYYVPKIILQPFIENSMNHGYSENFEGTIKIIINIQCIQELNNEYMSIEITDNGRGLPEEWTIDDSTGIGIKNVQERIWMYCGKSYGIELFSNLNGGGARVRIKLPIINRNLQEWLDKEVD